MLIERLPCYLRRPLMSYFRQVLAQKQLIILDLDGTILDLKVNWPLLRSKLNQLVAKYELPNDTFNEGLDKGIEKVEHILNEAKLKIFFELIEEYETQHIEDAKENIKLLEIFDQDLLKKNIAVFSLNMRKTVLSALNLPKVSRYLSKEDIFIVAKEDVRLGKPNPEGLFKVLSHFNIHKDDSIFIGNSDSDFIAGKLAGIETLDVRNI